ncbi:cellulose biosynthesis protein BcsP [Paraburkholderia phymatum]|nr:cellulose biosynthesis protein BcsP [Paraburkholderia phymatum]
MSVSDDVGNLFRRFGGDAGQYQEVARDDEAKQAALRWPLLNALDIAHVGPVPDAGRPGPAAAPGCRPEPAVASPAGRREQPVRATATSTSESTGAARLPLFARGHRHATMPPPVTPARTGANRFSAPPAVAAAPDPAPAAERKKAAANAVRMAAAPVAAPAAPPVAAAPAAARPVPPVTPAFRVSALHHVAQSDPGPSCSGRRQSFGPAPFTGPVPEGTRDTAWQQGGSILSGLFGGKAAPSGALAAAPSKDLSTLFARLSRGPAAPARSLRDTLRTRFKADGEA